jgi:hypothetical protein
MFTLLVGLESVGTTISDVTFKMHDRLSFYYSEVQHGDCHA